MFILTSPNIAYLLLRPTVGAILSGSRPATPMNIDFMRSNKV